MDIKAVYDIIILILSISIHEFAHAWSAYKMGDPTPKVEGRLTINPIAHLDLFGSIILPALFIFSGSGIVFGWAKPVIINPYNLRPGRFSEAKVALAGPISNLLVALVFAQFIKFQNFFVDILPFLNQTFFNLVLSIVVINVVLAIFNLIPLPPLDGSRLLFAFFPKFTTKYRYVLETFGAIFVLIFILFFWRLLGPVVSYIIKLFI